MNKEQVDKIITLYKSIASVKELCREVNISDANLSSGRISLENKEKVADAMIEEIERVYKFAVEVVNEQ